MERVVGSSSTTLTDESLPETYLPAPYKEPLETSNYGRKRVRVERDDYVSWENIVFYYNISTPIKDAAWIAL